MIHPLAEELRELVIVVCVVGGGALLVVQVIGEVLFALGWLG